MKLLLRIYNVGRAIVFSAILTMVGFFLAIYILMSVPAVQRSVCNKAELEISKFLGSKTTIGEISFHPFNRLIIKDVDLYSPDGNKCIHIDEAGAGIRLMSLLRQGRIEISFAEVIGLDAAIRQEAPEKPLNIQFLIDAFKPKEKKKPTKIDLSLQAVVIRRGAVSFDREWLDHKAEGRFDPNHVAIRNLRADVVIPRISNDSVAVELKRLAFNESCGLTIEKIAANVNYGTVSGLNVKDLTIALPASNIYTPSLHLTPDILSRGEGSVAINLPGNTITPSDLAPLYAPLAQLNEQFKFSVKAFASKEDIDLRMLNISSRGIDLDAKGSAVAYACSADRTITLDNLRLEASPEFVSRLLGVFKPGGSTMVKRILPALGGIDVDASGTYSAAASNIKGYVACALGQVDIDATLHSHGNAHTLAGDIRAKGLDKLLTTLIPGLDASVHSLSGNVDIDLTGNNAEGSLELDIPSLTLSGLTASNMRISALKSGDDASLSLSTDEGSLFLMADIQGVLNKALPSFAGDISLRGTIPYRNAYFSPGDFGGYSLGGDLSFDVIGGDINTMEGFADLHRFYLKAPDGSRSLNVDRLMVNMETTPDSLRNVVIDSDLLKGTITGSYNIGTIPAALMSIASRVLPSWIKAPETTFEERQDMEMNLVVLPNNSWTEFFNLPIRLLTDVEISGAVDTEENIFDLTVQTPYLQQGKDKLIRDVRLGIGAGGEPTTMSLEASATLPAKDSTVTIGLDATGREDNLATDVRWRFNKPKQYNGLISMTAAMSRQPLTGEPTFNLNVLPSQFLVNDTTWHVGRGSVVYADGKVEVNSLRVWHKDQHVSIFGKASAQPGDMLTVSLQDFDLDYLFDTLAINFVDFGGRATGMVYATDLLTSCPKAYTDSIGVKNLTYFDSLLGEDAVLSSRWVNDEMKVTIGADIREGGKRTALVDGGIWVTRDSLSLNLSADKVNVGFLHPFLKEFSTGVKGRASGHCHLFGTFSDVDLEGRLLADTVALQVGFTKVWYGGRDSVIIDPGHIEIPRFRAYDSQGNSALFSGVLDHKYFRAPVFEFQVREAKDLLLLDTKVPTEQNNWYGTIYGTGGGTIKGGPGFVNMTVDMATAPKSTFNFILDNRRVAEDYDFLTFTDRRKEQAQAETEVEGVIDFESMFRKKKNEQQGEPSTFNLDLRASITPDATITLVMDPRSGDKITGHGNGSLQLLYDSGKDDLGMFGKYTITEGNYNFTLQDLIIKDFTIREGSSVAFNGDPMNAILDINALYRTTTNLSDLDKSFSTDRDLNRTNVPVDAVLKLQGDINTPEISFDIELPTLTADVQRKVKSIISTDDMMNRQIIYLLALGKFYTPEYTGSSTNGSGEMASLATTTISSQISNLLGQLSNHVTVAPSIRSDKGDFSDLEFDVALSSRLLNNRLLINGNFGYRDPSTSSSTFIGDFDIEYLLTRNGKLRLKAYNHFNDQNYYLKSSLTTQGVGILWRHDFGTRPRRTAPIAEPSDSSKSPNDARPSGIESFTDSVTSNITK